MAAHDRYRLEPDSWLSGILGRPSWNAVSGGSASAALSELKKPGQFASAKVDAADTAAAGELQAHGFRVIDTALTLERENGDALESGSGVRFAAAGDRSAVESIAGSAFKYSRFHLDPAIPKTLADRIKATWAGNWFAGQRGDGMVVAEDGGDVAGFLQLLWNAEDRLIIDLIAVRAQSARKGLARAMIGFAQKRGTGDARHVRVMIVGTQAANVASVRLYESLGFRLRGARFVLHHHGGAA